MDLVYQRPGLESNTVTASGTTSPARVCVLVFLPGTQLDYTSQLSLQLGVVL